MNAAVRAVTRMGIYVGAQVYLIHEVYYHDTTLSLIRLNSSGDQVFDCTPYHSPCHSV